MGYRQEQGFDQPNAEDVERSRKTLAWLIPLVAIQQGLSIFNDRSSFGSELLSVVAWILLSWTVMAMMSGWKFRWMSDRDHALLNDEWHKAVYGDACRWALAATLTLGTGLMFARYWVTLDVGQVIYVIVNGAVVTAALRYAWLNRGDTDDDE